jgi:hypothetical protein
LASSVRYEVILTLWTNGSNWLKDAGHAPRARREGPFLMLIGRETEAQPPAR